ncbi:MAG TPA: hypothetical protein VNT26_11070 [Candidatus Sulfotelmatobacter sp.]|nr:hypothetical protein [Candidatus Sulfotelmatobacter sp.]
MLGCTRGVVGGNPTLAAASSNGTSRFFEGTEAEIGAAITNAFDGVGYHDMLFVPIDPTVPFTVPPGRVVTNGFELLHGLQAASTVPLDNGKSLPYDADFYITIEPGPSNRTTVTVRTVDATVRDGQELGSHGGWAIHRRRVTPVQREEDNVLTAISDQLKKRK